MAGRARFSASAFVLGGVVSLFVDVDGVHVFVSSLVRLRLESWREKETGERVWWRLQGSDIFFVLGEPKLGGSLALHGRRCGLRWLVLSDGGAVLGGGELGCAGAVGDDGDSLWALSLPFCMAGLGCFLLPLKLCLLPPFF